MTPASFWRVLFTVAAAFNLTVGLALLSFAGAILPLLGMTAPSNPLFLQLAAGLVAVFGVGYALAAHDPVANRGIVLIGAIGKAPVPLIVWLNMQAGHASAQLFMLSLGDLAFAIAFVVYLMRPRAA